MIVAVTGIILILFVVGHLLGNLQIFIGPDWINGYSEHLRDLGPLLWLIRIFLLATVLIHIYVTIQLAIENRRARPDAYIDKRYVKATFASRHMVMSGLIVLAFIIYHLAHFHGARYGSRLACSRLIPSALRRLLHDGIRISELLCVGLLHPRTVFARASFKPWIIQLLSIAWIE
jgi:succinate dehydrogenase (or fumarate reductase) cytochrome b subunit, b558 family